MRNMNIEHTRDVAYRLSITGLNLILYSTDNTDGILKNTPLNYLQ